MKIIILFSGYGGLDLGFERAGFEIHVANEFDPTIWEIFKVNHPNTKLIEDDIRKINEGGKLNQPSRKNKLKIHIPEASLPTRIVSFGFKPDSTNIVKLYMDGG